MCRHTICEVSSSKSVLAYAKNFPFSGSIMFCVILTLNFFLLSYTVNAKLMPLFFRNGAIISDKITIDVEPNATVHDLIETFIDCEYEKSGIPQETLRKTITLEFRGKRLLSGNSLLTDLGISSKSVVVYNTNLYHLQGPLIPNLVHYRHGMDPIEIPLRDIDWWIPLTLADPDLLNALKSQLKHWIASNGTNALYYNLPSDVPHAFQLKTNDSSYLEYPPVNAYIRDTRPEWFAQYVLSNGTKLHFLRKDFIKSQRDLQQQLQIQWNLISPLKRWAHVVKTALFSQLRSSHYHLTDSTGNQFVIRSKSILVWESEPKVTDCFALQIKIPQGYDVLFDVRLT